jgi:hypothetical protein
MVQRRKSFLPKGPVFDDPYEIAKALAPKPSIPV